jgi:hypothetical protein
LSFDQRVPVLGLRSLDGVVQRGRQSLFEVLRNEAITLALVAIVKKVGYRLQLFDKLGPRSESSAVVFFRGRCEMPPGAGWILSQFAKR